MKGPPTHKEIGMHMRAYRERSRATQAEFARMLGISQATVSKYERAVGGPVSVFVYLAAQGLAMRKGKPRRG